MLSLGVVAMLLAPLWHESGGMAPLLVAIVACMPTGRCGDPRARQRALRLAAVGAIASMAWVVVLLSLRARYPAYTQAVDWSEIVSRWLRYPGLLVFPLQEAQWRLAPVLHAVFGAAAAAGAVFLLRRRPRTPAAALSAWAYAALLPFCLVPMPGSWLEPRYLYGAALPACGLAALALQHAARSTRPALRRAAMAAAVTALAGTLVLQSMLGARWRDLARAGEGAGLASLAAMDFERQSDGVSSAVAPRHTDSQ
jgi:hypothetical protein